MAPTPPFFFATIFCVLARTMAIAFLTLSGLTVTIKKSGDNSHLSPRRLARPRTPPFHGDNTGSNPVGDANLIHHLQIPSRIL